MSESEVQDLRECIRALQAEMQEYKSSVNQEVHEYKLSTAEEIHEHKSSVIKRMYKHKRSMILWAGSVIIGNSILVMIMLAVARAASS